MSAGGITLYSILHIINRLDYIESTCFYTRLLERREECERKGLPTQVRYTHGWNLDALRIKRHTYIPTFGQKDVPIHVEKSKKILCSIFEFLAAYDIFLKSDEDLFNP